MAGTSTGGGAGHEDDTQGDGASGASGAAPHDAAPLHDPAQLHDADVEARWADLVAQFGEVDGAASSAPAAPGPSTEATPGSAGHVVARTTGPRDWPTTPDVEALEEAESHFAPPDPGPVVTGRDPLNTLAWACAVGIPLLAVIALIVRSFVPALRVPGIAGPVGVVVFLAGVAVLVWRMPQRRDPDDHDDGAIV